MTADDPSAARRFCARMSEDELLELLEADLYELCQREATRRLIGEILAQLATRLPRQVQAPYLAPVQNAARAG